MKNFMAIYVGTPEARAKWDTLNAAVAISSSSDCSFTEPAFHRPTEPFLIRAKPTITS